MSGGRILQKDGNEMENPITHLFMARDHALASRGSRLTKICTDDVFRSSFIVGAPRQPAANHTTQIREREFPARVTTNVGRSFPTNWVEAKHPRARAGTYPYHQ